MITLLSPPGYPADVSHARSVEDAVDRAAEIAAFAATNAGALDRTGTFPVEEFARLQEAGLFVAPLPRAYGGLGLGSESGGTEPTLRLLTHLGRGNLAVGRVYEGHVNALGLIHTFGTPAQMERFAQDAHAGHLFSVWNAGAADDVRLVPQEDGELRMEGAKTFCSGGSYVTRPFAPGALPDGGWQMVIVPMEQVETRHDPSWWEVSGMRSTLSYKVDFTGVTLPPEYVIGAPWDYQRQPWLSGGAIRFAAVQLGGAQALFEATRRYLQGMERTSDPYQVQRAADTTIALEGARLWLTRAAAINDDPARTAEEIVIYANMTRTVIERTCMDVMQAAERTMGVRGMMAPLPMERIIRDLTVYLRQPAPDAALASAGRYALDVAPYFDPLANRETGA